MRGRRILAATVTSALLVGGGVAAATEGDTAPNGPPEHVLTLARGAAAEARAAAQELGQDPSGVSQGFGSEAFAERHASLASRHAEHPGNAARVHAALAAGQSPAGLGQAQADAVHALNEARKALGGSTDDDRPGRGLGRGNGGPGTGGDDDADEVDD